MACDIDKGTIALSTSDTARAQPCSIGWIRLSERPELGASASANCSLVDLFCGCGGLTLGVAEALRLRGISTDIRLAVDVSSPALQVYRRNFGVSQDVARHMRIENLVPGSIGDAIEGDEAAIRAKYQGIDILVAGPPCQGHSDLNNSTRRNDPRNGLYLKAIRFAELTMPRVLLIENVPGAVHDRDGVVHASQSHLRRIGYATRAMLLDASMLGLAQTRRRHILLGARGGPEALSEFGLTEHQPGDLYTYISDIRDECASRSDLYRTPSRMTEANKERVAYMFRMGLHDLPNSQRPPCHRDKTHTYVSMYGRLSWGKPAQTITSGFGSMGQGRFVHPDRQRVLTPHEAARIQGFPDFFDFSSVQSRVALHEMIGNAVPPRLSAVIISRLLDLGLLD